MRARHRHRGGSSATAHAGLSAECARGPARPGEDEVPARVVLRVSIPTSRGPTVETCSFTSIRGSVKMQRLERLEKMETSRRGKKRENVPQGTFRRRKSFLRTFLYQPKFATSMTLILVKNTPVGRPIGGSGFKSSHFFRLPWTFPTFIFVVIFRTAKTQLDTA